LNQVEAGHNAQELYNEPSFTQTRHVANPLFDGDDEGALISSQVVTETHISAFSVEFAGPDAVIDLDAKAAMAVDMEDDDYLDVAQPSVEYVEGALEGALPSVEDAQPVVEGGK
jgi:hypothetical protein